MDVALSFSTVNRGQQNLFAYMSAALVIAALLICSGCGGGGGGTRTAPPPPAGSFTLSGTSATFAALQAESVPATQVFDITITGSGASFVGAAYPSGQTQPTWLTVAISGSGTNYQMTVGVLPSAVNTGQYSTTFSVGTADSSGNVLTHQDFTV